MAKFEGVRWAPNQLQWILKSRQKNFLSSDAKTYAVSRSIHYGIFLVFEGIRFFAYRDDSNRIAIRFCNLDKNLERFLQGLAYSLGPELSRALPTKEELRTFIVDDYLLSPMLRPFLLDMLEDQAQGYLRPFTLDEEQSIGVTFPANPSIRLAACKYDRYLGEPFEGVVIPHLVRAVRANQTGCLKLGTNYLISVKAVEEAKRTEPNANAALFLDDRCDLPLHERELTEWDSSCILLALRDGRIIKIPEGPLILPSVTIRGIVSLAREEGIPVEERAVRYGELIELVKTDQLVCICSIGTAGILNRCSRLSLLNAERQPQWIHEPDTEHPLYEALARLRRRYWQVYKGEHPAPLDMKIYNRLVSEP
ncbi:MAG: aminotransferase class IV [Myxococcota bacterium]|nr:aminotransferase class IV [Myxococcota bacterium]